jgi:MerR family mercuric resistance operon transcriptional regulator
LSFIRRCRELGFNLDEIRGLLSLVDGKNYTCAEVLGRTNAHIEDIKAKVRDLKKMQQTLMKMASSCSGEDVPECPIVETLWH